MQWVKRSVGIAFWERSDGAAVRKSTDTLHSDVTNLNARMWVAYTADGHYLAKKAFGTQSHAIPRKFKTAEAAMNALDLDLGQRQ